MVTDKFWQDFARNLLKAELKRYGLTYKDLAQRLTDNGTPDSAENLANKISRGGFSAAFLFQCLSAIGCQNIELPRK
jgi:uncharacterized protein CbrC (UPF0167 family)